MSNARRDANYVPTLIAANSSDVTLAPVQLVADSATNRLLVDATVSGSFGGSSAVDNSAFTANTTAFTVAGGFYHSTVDSVTDGRAAAVGLTAKRGMFVNLQTAAGVETGVAAAPLQVSVANTGANATAMLVTGTGGTFPVTGTVTAISGTASNLKVAATLDAETTKVIGVVRNSDGAGNLWTSNSTTYTAKFGQDSNLLGTLGTAFSTAGKVDVKVAAGDIAAGASSFVKLEDVASADADAGVATLGVRKAAPANTSNTDGDYEFLQLSAGRQWVWAQPNVVTISTTITRPSDTNAYAANDAFANSTSAPTSGGFTLTGAALVSGGSGVITDCIISASAGTNYNGELWIFDQAVTATNDNAALSVSDSDVQNLIGVIPFQTSDVNAANSISYITGLNIGFTCVGTANLRFVVKIMAAATPASAEVLSVRVKVNN